MRGRGASGDKTSPLLIINRGMIILVQERDGIRICLYADNYNLYVGNNKEYVPLSKPEAAMQRGAVIRLST